MDFFATKRTKLEIWLTSYMLSQDCWQNYAPFFYVDICKAKQQKQHGNFFWYSHEEF